MFRGITNLSLDMKGRMAMPAKYRERLLECCDGNMVMTIDPTNANQESCLFLYPLQEWEKIQAKIDALSSFDRASRRVQRLLVGHAEDVLMDKAGRILIPMELREYAGIDKKTILIGQGKKFELWNEEKWNVCRDSWLDHTTEDGSDGELPADLISLSL